MQEGTVWRFRTKRFTVELQLSEEPGYCYDGEDEDGETQAALDSGEFVAFDSRVIVYLDDEEIGSDSLCGSVYAADSVAEFWTAHRDPNPMNRNCSEMRAARGSNVCICHYFPGMVRQAISEARAFLCSAPRMRCAA
jgi:hypothetical protein